MFFLYIFSSIFLFMRYKSRRPLSRALYLILSLIIISPLLSLINHQWFIYLMLILFLRGIFVIIIYFSRLSTFSYKYTRGLLVFFIIYLFFFPFIIYLLLNKNISLLFMFERLYIIVFLIVSLIILMLFSRYFLSQRIAIRRF
jgi:NADH-ubiquinone oxidoreductase chain 6